MQDLQAAARLPASIRSQVGRGGTPQHALSAQQQACAYRRLTPAASSTARQGKVAGRASIQLPSVILASNNTGTPSCSLDCAVVRAAVVAELHALADVYDAPELLLTRHTLQLGVAEAPARGGGHAAAVSSLYGQECCCMTASP
jgi:hypothetical protein